MKNYVLDSDTLIYFLKGDRDVIQKMSKVSSENLFTTRINYTELLYGAYNSSKVDKNLSTIIPFLKNFHILEFDKNSSKIFAKLKSSLKKDGNLIADMDLMIASITISYNFTLVTNNIKHFKRIKELKVENWR